MQTGIIVLCYSVITYNVYVFMYHLKRNSFETNQRLLKCIAEVHMMQTNLFLHETCLFLITSSGVSDVGAQLGRYPEISFLSGVG